MKFVQRFMVLAPGAFLGISLALFPPGEEGTAAASPEGGKGAVSISSIQNDTEPARKTGVLWDETPIREALTALEQQSGQTLWLDRRIDPAFPVSGTFQNASAEQILQEALRPSPFRVSQLTDGLLFTAPENTAILLRTLLAKKRHELRENLPSSDQKKWLTERSVAWDHLTEPKAVLEKLAQTMKFEIRDLSKLPHDLWPERPPMHISGLDAALLILIQFDLTLEFTSEGVKTVPLDPRAILISRTYAASEISEEQLAAVRNIPGTRTMQKGAKILVRGTLEVHESLAGRSVSGASRKAETKERTESQQTASRQAAKRIPNTQNSAHAYGLKPGETVSGTVKGPFIPYVKALCSQYGLTLEADEDALRSAGIDPAKHVEVTADKATLEELFSMMAAEASCDAELDGPTLTIRPKR